MIHNPALRPAAIRASNAYAKAIAIEITVEREAELFIDQWRLQTKLARAATRQVLRDVIRDLRSARLERERAGGRFEIAKMLLAIDAKFCAGGRVAA